MSTGLPLMLPWHLPPHHALTSTQSQEGSSNSFKEMVPALLRSIPSLQAREVLSKLVFVQTVLIMHQENSPLTPINLGSLTATAFSERQSL